MTPVREVFRDETVAYASLLWKSGVSAELHIWQGAFHGVDIFFPDAAVVDHAIKIRAAWPKLAFGLKDTSIACAMRALWIYQPSAKTRVSPTIVAVH